MARVPDSKRFRLTMKVVDLGLHAIGRSDLRELARPILRSLVGEISEAPQASASWTAADVLYVERVRAGLTRLGVDIRIGTLIPASVVGVIGHAILAFLPPRDRERVLTTPPRAAANGGRRRSRDPKLERILEAVRQRGYALEDSAVRQRPARVLAVPVLDTDGYPVASISVAAPVVRMPMDEFRTRALAPLQQARARDRPRRAGERHHLDGGLETTAETDGAVSGHRRKTVPMTATATMTAAGQGCSRRAHSPAPGALIEAKGIVKIYPTVSGEPVLALDQVDMSVEDGEFVCLVGPSGCGKSTLMRLLAGLDRADAGTFSLGGTAIDGPSAEVGVVFQQATLLPWLTVWQNVTLPLRGGRLDIGDREAPVRELLQDRGAAGLREQISV